MTTVNREAFVAQVATAMMSRLDALERFLGSSMTGLRGQVYQRAQELAEQMEDPNTEKTAARTLMDGLYGPDKEPPEFWRTEVGQAVARAIGYHKPAVPFVTAASILGVTRQRVYQMYTTEGRLQRIEGTDTVTRASVREALLSQGLRRP